MKEVPSEVSARWRAATEGETAREQFCEQYRLLSASGAGRSRLLVFGSFERSRLLRHFSTSFIQGSGFRRHRSYIATAIKAGEQLELWHRVPEVDLEHFVCPRRRS